MPAMTPAERESLELLIQGATASPILMALARAKGIDAEQYVLAARHIATDGLQVDEARAFIRAMQDPDTAAAIGAVLSAIPPEAEHDRRVLDWAWVESWSVIRAASPEQPATIPTGHGFRFATDFLTGWDGGRCDLFQLSAATTAGERAANLAHKRLHGYTTVCPYFHNAGDGDGKHPVNALADRAHTNAVLDEMRAAGLAVVPFLFSDSHRVSKADQPRIALETVKAFDSKVAAYCLFLEPKDTTDNATLEKVATAVRGATKKLIFIHTYPAASDPASIRQYTGQSWCDGVLVQVSHPAKPIPMANVPRVAHGLLDAANGKIVVAMEYSWTTIERDMGDAWAANGLHGVGDGCNAVTVPKLPLLTRRGAVRPPVVPPEPAHGVIRWSLYSWPVTGRLDRVIISGGKMRFEGDWSSFKPFKVGKEVVATCWIGIPDGKGNYDMTSWEFMTAGNPTRDLATVEPGHLERDWRPVSGQLYPIALANGGRHGKHMLKQRTDAVWITWP